MLPILNHLTAVSPLTSFETKTIKPFVLEYLEQLKRIGFNGDIETEYSSRLVAATDNSVYQQLPQAVLYPKNNNDVILITSLGTEAKYDNVTFSPRGGGTGTNGQSLTSGIIVDFSRYMNKVLEINPQQGWVRVQTGIVKDKLNDQLKPYNLFFSPELSTSNRATLGGMINTDACGQGSLVYGKTSDHVLSLQAIFADGSLFESDGSCGLPVEGSFAAAAYTTTEQICREHRQAILDKFPPLNRFLTGYDLKNALNDDGEFNFTRVLCGAEGSLAFITEAKLSLTPIPTVRTLINIKYQSFDAALRHAPFMVKANALSVETIDSTVLNLAKQDIVWHSVKDLLHEVAGKEMLGINIVEFAGLEQQLVESQVDALITQLDDMLSTEQHGVIGYQICHDLVSIERIYAMRKKAVGLLGATAGNIKPLPFAEDTCVPPENLADYIAEFRALLDQHQLHYGMFGHVDAGVLHVRPALDLCDPQQEILMHQLSDHIVKLVAKYGGLMWGEHGKGYRSQYSPDFFGPLLYQQLRIIKAAFDPLNKMNPGKICTPINSDAELVKVSDTKRAFYDRQIDIVVRDSFKAAMECNGNGLCFNYDVNSPMCPSMKVMADRRHSPKGRSTMIREWLRLLSEQNIDLLALEQQILNSKFSFKEFMRKFAPLFSQQHDQFNHDFSHQVYEVMNGCLACKACASLCPIKVDVSSFRARFLNLYHSRYPRPVKDYLVANIEMLLPIMAGAPTLFNNIISQTWVENLTRRLVGYRDTPKLSTPTLSKQLTVKSQPSFPDFDISTLANLSPQQRDDYVLVVQDPFTSYYDAKVVADFMALIDKLGKTPILLPFKPNGKAEHIKGFLKKFSRTAQNSAEFLNQVAALNIAMVGVDPALVLCYRDEYVEILGDKRGDFKVLTVHEWLLPRLEQFPTFTHKDSDSRDATEKTTTSQPIWYLFAHCTEKTKLPNAEKEWGAIFSHFGQVLQTIAVGCCGMAGTFGHEVDKFELSQNIYNLSWKPRLEQLPKERCLITGYSCRSQIKRFEHETLLHPLQALLQVIHSSN